MCLIIKKYGTKCLLYLLFKEKLAEWLEDTNKDLPVETLYSLLPKYLKQTSKTAWRKSSSVSTS